jgi:small subunit ribosomal protein S4e
MGHLKRLPAPSSWTLSRKGKKWTVKTSPGPHKLGASIPLLLAVRDLLGYARTNREARRIINEGKIYVDKKVRKDGKFPLGLMDILEIPAVGKRWILGMDSKGTLALKELSEKSSKYKLCRIEDKRMVRGGHLQLNLHDGRNLLLKKGDVGVYKTKDALLIDLKKNAIKKHLTFREGSLAYVTGGAHRSAVATIEEIRVVRSPEPNVVLLSSGEKRFQTIAEYVFPIGEKKCVIPELVK